VGGILSKCESKRGRSKEKKYKNKPSAFLSVKKKKQKTANGEKKKELNWI